MIDRTPPFPVRRRIIAHSCIMTAFVIGVVVHTARPVRAMINPSFTPIQLVNEAQGIIAGKLNAATEPDRWALADVRALKGPKAEELRLSLAIANATDAKEARDFLKSAAGSEAILFYGEQTSYLLVGNIWMEAKAAGGDAGYRITEFGNQRLPKTYAGAADKLIAMADYILHDPDASVPVAADVEWSRHLLVGKLPGPPVGMTVLVGGKGAGDRLFLAGRDGDRLFAFDRAKDKFADRTKTAGLVTASRAWAFVDLDHNGCADLASWDGTHLRVLFGDKAGAFAPDRNVEPFPLPGFCIALVALSPSHDDTPGLLVDRDWPELLNWTGRGWQRNPLPGGKAPRLPAGANSCCVVADWDGDGYVDILQIRDQDSLLWRGTRGGFGEPVFCNVKSGGFPVRSCIGDFDTDGRPDLLICGLKTHELWENAGDGTFRSVARFAGSIATLDPGVVDCLAADLNHDGRPDVVTLGPEGQFAYHFNRGYRCLADEGTLELDAEPSAVAQPAGFRPVRVAAGDFDGDGCLDLVASYSTGEVLCFLNGQFTGPATPPGLWVRLPAGCGGPITVSAWQGEGFPVCVGTFSVCSYLPTYISLRTDADCTLQWREPGGPLRSLKVRPNSESQLPLPAPQ